MGNPRDIKAIAEEVLTQIELEKDAPSTGFPDLDKCIKGFLPRHLYTMTGETNSGKTILACNFADAVRKQGKKVLYVALEPDINVIQTLASVRTGKNYDKLTTEDIVFSDGMIDILVQEDVRDVGQLLSIINKSATKYSLIVIDHISYFVTSENTTQQQSNVLKTLAKMTKQFQTAIVVIAHLRKGVSGYITMDDIAGSAAFKQDSTEVLILHRTNTNEENALPIYSPEGKIYVPKTKVFSKHKVATILFQENTAKILSKYYADGNRESN